MKTARLSILVALMIGLAIGGTFIFSLFIRHKTVAMVNGRPIYEEEFSKRQFEASSLRLRYKKDAFEKMVLEEMINAELLYQEAIRRYGGLPREEAIARLVAQEVKEKAANKMNLDRLERARLELDYYRQLVEKLRKNADINEFLE